MKIKILLTFVPPTRNKEGVASITCKLCGLTSHNINDCTNLYCGKCHVFHQDVSQALCSAQYDRHIAFFHWLAFAANLFLYIMACFPPVNWAAVVSLPLAARCEQLAWQRTKNWRHWAPTYRKVIDFDRRTA